MEARSTTSGDTSDDHATDRESDEAQWRPGFDGWDEVAESDDVVVPEEEPTEPGDDHGIEWSRDVAEAEREPWVPVRPVRVRPTAPLPAGRPVATVDGVPPSAATGQVVLVGIVVFCLVAAAAVAVAAIRPRSTPEPVARAAPSIPEQVDVAWTAELDAPVAQVATSADVVVATTSPDADLVAFDMATGSERWRQSPFDGARAPERIAVIDDVVVVQHRGATGAPVVSAFSAITGEALWTGADDGTNSIVDLDDGHAVLRRFRADGRTQAVSIDPFTGAESGEAIQVGAVSVPGPFLGEEPVAGTATIWSIESGPLDGPVVDSFNLRTIAALGDGLVGLDLESRIVTFDEDGLRTDERPFTSGTFGDFTSRADLVGVVDRAEVAVIGSGSSLGFTVDDGSIEILWQRTGRASRPVLTADGAFSVVVGPDETGEINSTIIDPVTGATVAETDDDGTREAEPMLGHEAYVVAPAIGSSERIVTAFDYDGTEIWALRVPASSDYFVTDGVVVVAERVEGGATLTVHR